MAYDMAQVGMFEVTSTIQELLMRTRHAKVANNNVFICCPFHSENTPSLSVTLNHEKFLPGTFHCFGCGKSGNWNTLAAALNIPYRISIADMQAELKAHSYQYHNTSGLAASTTQEFLRNQNYAYYTPWVAGKSWRKVHSSFLVAIDAYRIYEQEEQKIFLPVKVMDVVEGGIRASLQYKKYTITPGNWVKTRGLFPYNLTRELLQSKVWKHDFVVLVEGARDVARLILQQVPALALLGTNQWSESKIELIHALTPNDLDVILMLDSDRAGREATYKIAASLKSIFNLRIVTLPNITIAGEKCDVFNLPPAEFENLMFKLRRRYGW